MFRSRSRFTAALAAFALAVGAYLWSCAPAATVTVAGVDLAALRDTILAAVPPDAMFDPDTTYSEEDEFGGFLGTGKTRGLIQPHRNANAGPLTHLKFLARMRVSKDFRGMVGSRSTADTIWNYWVVGFLTTTAARRPQWVSIYVAPAESGHIEVRKLTAALSPAPHARGMAKWRHSKVAPWASCSDNMCCCEDSQCKTPLSAHNFLLNRP